MSNALASIDVQLNAARDFADTLVALKTTTFRVRVEVFPVLPRGPNQWNHNPDELIEASSAHTRLALTVTYFPEKDAHETPTTTGAEA